MDDAFYEKTLYRILQGRLRLTLGDLVLYVHEPTPELIEESFDIYDEAYKKAYFRGVYIKKELVEILVNNDLWSPFDDREAEKIEKQIEIQEQVIKQQTEIQMILIMIGDLNNFFKNNI